MSLELKHEHELGGHQRIEQLGVWFPDGSIIWANLEGENPAEQNVRWNERYYYLRTVRNPGAAKFAHLKQDYERRMKEMRIEPYDEAIRLVKRLVIVYFDEAQEVEQL